jgi:hypothetical protein
MSANMPRFTYPNLNSRVPVLFLGAHLTHATDLASQFSGSAIQCKASFIEGSPHPEGSMKKLNGLLLHKGLRGSFARIFVIVICLIGIFLLPQIMGGISFICPSCNVNYSPRRHLALFYSACIFAAIPIAFDIVRALTILVRKRKGIYKRQA